MKRRYTGKTGEKFIEFITWNYANGVRRGDTDCKNEPGHPDIDAWFDKSSGGEIKVGIEVKSKKTQDYCVIDDKVLYNLLRVQTRFNIGRQDVIICFFFVMCKKFIISHWHNCNETLIWIQVSTGIRM